MTKKKRPGNPARAGGRKSAAPSLSSFRAGRAVDALTPAFVSWFDDQNPGSASSALAGLAEVKGVLGRYLEHTAAADVTDIDPVLFGRAVGDEMAARETHPNFAYDVVFLVLAIEAFVEFLADTGRWSGSDEHFAQLRELIALLKGGAGDDDYDDYDESETFIDVPDIPDEEAVALFCELPLMHKATALLQWIGDGKDVTGTGVLRLKDIEAAAASIGLTVRGSSKRIASPPVDEPGADPVPTVQSMFQVPLLALLWFALRDSELIEIGCTRMRPSTYATGLAEGEPAERREDMEFFVEQFLEDAVLSYDREHPMDRLVTALVVSILLAAATQEPPEKDRTLAPADGLPEEQKAAAVLLTRVALARLEDLADLGVLTIDTHFRVPRVLIRSVADVFDDEWVLSAVGLLPGPDEDSDRSTPNRRVRATRESSAPSAQAARAKPAAGVESVLQLKIMLDGSTPPIWRRVLIPSGMPLSRLHHVIQTLFGWHDDHLHHFQTAGRRGPTYIPIRPGEDDLFGRELDEASVTVGELLPAIRSKMNYTYDFGDDWEHVITVEKVLTAYGAEHVPRCTAGRGAAPVEDSGGVWGWANIIDAVNDPRHPEHEERRDWMGLRPGQTLDPDAFDLDKVNRVLAAYF